MAFTVVIIFIFELMKWAEHPMLVANWVVGLEGSGEYKYLCRCLVKCSYIPVSFFTESNLTLHSPLLLLVKILYNRRRYFLSP